MYQRKEWGYYITEVEGRQVLMNNRSYLVVKNGQLVRVSARLVGAANVAGSASDGEGSE